MTANTHGACSTEPSIVTPLSPWLMTTPSTTRCRLTSIASPPPASRLLTASCRLRSTSAWLRSWIVATSATRSAMVHTANAPLVDLDRAGRLLGRADIGDLQAGVVGGERRVAEARDLQADAELDDADAKAR